NGTQQDAELCCDSACECAGEAVSTKAKERANQEGGAIPASTEYSIRPPDELSSSVRTALWLINFYRMAISPMLPPSCRFVPTCSQYTYLSIARFGLKRGSWLGLKRLTRCRPFGPSGYDPVPECDDE
ncbi:MAG TPA: membrane protein insertion efficiency factor YidD, partial [Abditibacteriaceae bacterium]|nr:membrane protein insertion efficiency factor YidD [Abditibacteriaceae bacterium]